MKKDTRQRPYPHYRFPDEITIEVEKLSSDSAEWFNMPVGSYLLRTVNYGWFPTSAVAGVVNRMYSDTNKIGFQCTGNMGTMTVGVVNAEKAVELLKQAGYNTFIYK